MDFCKSVKTRVLASILKISPVEAGGYTALLYAWAINNANDGGSINDYTDKAIETACLWEGKRSDLVKAFHASGIIEGDYEERDDANPLVIADWHTVAADILRKREADRLRQQKARERKQARSITQDVTQDVTRDVTLYKNKENKNIRVKEEKASETCGKPATNYNLETFARNQGFRVTEDGQRYILAMRAKLPDFLIMYALNEAASKNKCDLNYALGIMKNYVQEGYPPEYLDGAGMDRYRRQWSSYEKKALDIDEFFNPEYQMDDDRPF